MRPPSRYFVSYEDPKLVKQVVARMRASGVPESCLNDYDPVETSMDVDFRDLDLALDFAKKVQGDVFERCNIVDDCDEVDIPPGVSYSWDSQLVE